MNKNKMKLSELKIWIEAAEDLMGEEWYPSLEQWKKVRNKIFDIEEVVEAVQQVQAAQAIQQVQSNLQPTAPVDVQLPQSQFSSDTPSDDLTKYPKINHTGNPTPLRHVSGAPDQQATGKSENGGYETPFV